MFCPNCANKIETGQSFCRACGMKLGKSLDILSKNTGNSIEKIDWIRRAGFFSIGVAGGVALTILLIFLFAAMLRVSEDFGLGVFITLSIFLSGIVAVMFFEKYKPGKHQRTETEEQQEHFPPGQMELWRTNRQLKESTFEPIPSVTEASTDLIYVKKLKLDTSKELI